MGFLFDRQGRQPPATESLVESRLPKTDVTDTSLTSDPWAWINPILKLQKRDWPGYLTLIAALWTLLARIEDLRRQPDRSAAIGTIVLFMGFGVLTWTEATMARRMGTRQRWAWWVDVPKRIAIAFLIFGLVVELAFFGNVDRIRAFLGAAALGLFVVAIDSLYQKLSGHAGHDPATIIAFVLSGLILGWKIAFVVIMWCIFGYLIALAECLLEARRTGEGSLSAFSTPFRGSRLVLSIVPLMLATAILCLPGAGSVIARIYAKDAVQATEAVIHDLQKPDFIGPNIDPAMHQQLRQYYSQHTPRLLLTISLARDKNDGPFIREENAKFVFVTKRDAKGNYTVIKVYEGECWCF